MPDINPALERLGFSDTDRVALIHVDDVGMCEATVTAFDNLYRKGRVTCGAIMVPCPWFLHAAEICRQIQADLGHCDIGIHATLTSEWDHYRWGPISTRNPASGLMDQEGFFPKSEFELWAQAKAGPAKTELDAQVAALKATGLKPTHIDTHMGSPFGGDLYQGFTEVARKHGLFAFGLRLSEDQIGKTGRDAETSKRLYAEMQKMLAAGAPLPDRLFAASLQNHEDKLGETKALFDAIRPGQLAYVILHPAVDTPEIRAISPDWRARVADYETFMSDDLHDYITGTDIHLIGTKDLQALV